MKTFAHRKLRIGLLLLACGCATGTISRAAPLATPADYGFTTPAPDPELPPEMDIFTPPLLGAASGLGVAEFTRTAAPDEVLTVAGPDFTKSTRSHFYGQTHADNAVTVDAAPIVAHPIAASVILPAKLPAWSTYLMWPRNGSTYGKPVAINRTEAWWLGSDEALPGETVAVYGRNLSHDNATSNSWLYIKSAQNAGIWIKPTSVNPYRVAFEIPADSTPGAYEVWIHNGHGGHFGWSGPISLTVLRESPWNGQDTNRFSVKDYGATGDGVTDDTDAIRNALAAADKAAPATLYFPAGTYIMNGKIELKNNVSWCGENRDTTAIMAGPLFTHTVESWWPALIHSDSSDLGHVEFKGLTIDGNGNLGAKKSLLIFRHHNYIKLTDCRFKWKGSPNGFNIGSNNHLTIANCEFIGDQVFLGDSKQVVVRDNDFRLTDFANAALISWGGSEVAIFNNRAQDDDPMAATLGGVGAGRFFVSQCHPESNRHFYIGDNTTINMAPPVNIGDSNQGEQILLEVGTSTMVEKPLATSPTTAEFTSAVPGAASQEALILKGRGTGQVRHVTAVTGKSITVAPAWSVVPDETSVIGVGAAQTRTVVYHNRLDGKRDYPKYETASVALSMYGNVSDVIFAENTITHMRTGLADEASQVPDAKTPTPSALYFNLIAHNSVDGAYGGVRVTTNYLTKDSGETWGHLGNTYRGNALTNLVQRAISFGADHGGFSGGALEQDVFEHNTVTNVPIAVWAGKATTYYNNPVRTRFDDLIFYKNTFDLGTVARAGSRAFDVSAAPTSHWSFGNNWIGFEKNTKDTDSVK